MDKQDISFAMGKRLKELREERGLSHDKLIKQLNERYGISVSRDSVMAYEISDKSRSKASKFPNMGMRAETLYCLADFYRVSLDYLLSNTDVKSSDTNLKSVCEYTGLSEQSVKNILCISHLESPPPAEVPPLYALDRILGSEYFCEMIKEAATLVGKGVNDPNVNVESELCAVLSDIESVLKEKFHLDFLVLYGSDVRDAYVRNVENILKDILDDMFYEAELKKPKPTEERQLGEVWRMPKEIVKKITEGFVQK